MTDTIPQIAENISPNAFGTYAGIALIILAVFIGLAIMEYGWPKFRK